MLYMYRCKFLVKQFPQNQQKLATTNSNDFTVHTAFSVYFSVSCCIPIYLAVADHSIHLIMEHTTPLINMIYFVDDQVYTLAFF